MLRIIRKIINIIVGTTDFLAELALFFIILFAIIYFAILFVINIKEILS